MGLSQSLYTGLSGLVTHQRALDNASNNLANVNTVGYRSSSFQFATLMSKAISGSLPADGDRASTNPKGLGLGTTTGAITNNFTPGAPEQTGNALNCYINEPSGKSFFLVGTSGGTAMTRNGDFWLDNHESSGRRMLVLGDGLPVQGWMAQNNAITPRPTTENIYLPTQGDMLAGKTTDSVTMSGVLPTNTSGTAFDGDSTDRLELKGNLASDGQSLNTHIYAPVTQTAADGTQVSSGTVEVPVRIDFHGPTLSEDGTTNQWTWTMSTVDYPNPGDSVQIYPAEGDPTFSQGTLNFHATASPQGFGAGQAVADTISPGSSSVTFTDADGVTTSFTLASDFTMNVSRLTNMSDAPGGNELETWFVDGRPSGTMSQEITVWDEYTEFVEGANGIFTAERRVGPRQVNVIFERGEQTNAGTTWNWSSSYGDASGTLQFDTRGDLVNNTQTGGPLQFEWQEMFYAATEGAVRRRSDDGYPDGFLNGDGLSIDENGVIWGTYSNEVSVRLAQLALGTVSNLNGLSGAAGTLFYPSSASGGIQIGVANDSSGGSVPSFGLGSIVSNALEASNVNTGREFTRLIAIERGFQFNSRIVTTADEMLQTALQLKR